MTQTPEQLAEKIAEWVQRGHLASVINARDAEVRAELLAPGPCGKHPNMFWHMHSLDPLVGCALCLELDKVRAETLAERHKVIGAKPVCLDCNHARIINCSHFDNCDGRWVYVPDPHYRERVELEARIDTAAKLGIGESNCPCTGHNYLREWKSRLAALDAPKGEVR